MNIGTIVTTNPKGQIVIPQKIRDALAIRPEMPLQLLMIGHSIVLHPITAVVRSIDYEDSYGVILKKTRGAWGIQQQPSTKKSLELRASARRKKSW